MFVEIICSFIASSTFTILLRRLDKSNLSLKKIHSFLHKTERDVENLVSEKRDHLTDILAKYEVLQMEGNKYLDAIQTSVTAVEERLFQVENQRENLNSLELTLKDFDEKGEKLVGQLRYINDSTVTIERQKRKVDQLFEQNKKIESVLKDNFTEIESNMNTYIKEQLSEFTKEITQFKEHIKRKYTNQERVITENLSLLDVSLQAKLSQMQDSVQEKVTGFSREVDFEIQKKRSTLYQFDAEIQRVFDSSFSTIEEQVHEKEKELKKLESSIVDNLKGFQTRLDTSFNIKEGDIQLLKKELQEGIEVLKIEYEQKIQDEHKELERVQENLHGDYEQKKEEQFRLLEEFETTLKQKSSLYFQEFKQNLEEPKLLIKKLQSEIEEQVTTLIEQLQSTIQKEKNDYRRLEKQVHTELSETVGKSKKLLEDEIHNFKDLKKSCLKDIESEHQFCVNEIKELSKEQNEKLVVLQSIQQEINVIKEYIEITAYQKIDEQVQDIILLLKEKSQEMDNGYLNFQKVQGSFNKHLESESESLNTVGKDYSLQHKEILEENKSIVKNIQSWFFDQKSSLESFIVQQEKNAHQIVENVESKGRILIQEVDIHKQDSLSTLKMDYEKNRSMMQDNIENYFEEFANKYKLTFKELEHPYQNLKKEISFLNQETQEKHVQSLDSLNKIRDEMQESVEKATSLINRDSEVLTHTLAKDTKKVLEQIEGHRFEIEQLSGQWKSECQLIMEKVQSQINKEIKQGLDISRKNLQEESNELYKEHVHGLSDLIRDFQGKSIEKEERFYGKLKKAKEDFSRFTEEIFIKQQELHDVAGALKSQFALEIEATSGKKIEVFEDRIEEGISRLKQDISLLEISTLDQFKDEVEVSHQRFTDLKEQSKSIFIQFENRQKTIIKSLEEDVARTQRDVEDLNRSLLDVQSSSKELREVAQNLDKVEKETIKFKEHLNTFHEKEKSISNLYKQVDDVKSAKIGLDSDLLLINQQRDKINVLQEQVQLILTLKSEIDDKSNSLKEAKDETLLVLEQQKKVYEEKGRLEEVFIDFSKQHEKVHKSLENLHEYRTNIDSMEIKVNNFDNLLEKLTFKVEDISGHAIQLDGQLLKLSKKESEIQSLEQRFLDIEDLIEDIERRKKHLNQIRSDFENLKSEMSESVENVQLTVHNADTKIKEIADFVNAIDPESTTNSINKKVRARKEAEIQNKSEYVVKLHDLGWTSEDISKRIDLDLSIIQTIISTYEAR